MVVGKRYYAFTLLQKISEICRGVAKIHAIIFFTNLGNMAGKSGVISSDSLIFPIFSWWEIFSWGMRPLVFFQLKKIVVKSVELSPCDPTYFKCAFCQPNFPEFLK